ncbi:MAG: rod shape-determining protein MreC [Acidobacteriota bacterium]
MLSNFTSKRNRDRATVILIPLLLFQLILLSVQTQDPGGMTPLRTLVLAIQAPVMHMANTITGGIGDLWHNYAALVDTRSKNKELQDKVLYLNRINRSYAEILLENARLQRLLDLKESIEPRTVGARVIARTPDFLSNVLYIDRGTKDGIQVDSPVVSGDGIVGRTVYVSKNESQVQLITNPDASIGAMIEGTRTYGVLQGTGDFLMDMKYISNAEEIHPGDNVLSSGLDKVYPKGFLIGKVTYASKNQGVFYDITVEPAVDLYRIEEVLILLTEP